MPNIVVMDASASHNLDVLLTAYQEKNLKDGVLKLVVSGDDDALARAGTAGIKTLLVTGDEPAEADLADTLESECHPALIVVLDWPEPLGAAFLDKFPNKVIGIRPTLSGQFPGGDAVQRTYEAYREGAVKWGGCHVHYLTAAAAPGKVIRQLVVPVEPKDTLERFEARMHKNEQWLLLKGVKQFLYELRTQRKRRNRQR